MPHRRKTRSAVEMRYLLCVLLVYACESAPSGSYSLPEASDPAPPVQPSVPEAPVHSAPALGVPAEPSVPEEELAQAFSSLSQVMAAMRDASILAAEAQDDVCLGARASMIAAAEAMNRTLDAHPLPGNRRPPPWIVAPEARYLELCRSLPAALQLCGRLDYKMQHADLCGQPGEHAATLEAMAHAGPGR